MIVKNWLNYLKMENKNLQEIVTINQLGSLFLDGRIMLKVGLKEVFLSQYLTNLMHKICFTISFISYLYMFRAHVLTIGRSKLYYTASGIITRIGVMIPDDEHMCSKHVEA